MGSSILEMVLKRLREGGFSADAAYPGQKIPQISGPVAAVHIHRADRADLTVTVAVHILCPAAMGGTACELEALRAVEILCRAGAVCEQNGCTYDGVFQRYGVCVLATFTGIAGVDSCELGPGFQAYINNTLQNCAIRFTEEETRIRQEEYVIGEAAPAAISRRAYLWNIELEELIPTGTEETADTLAPFDLMIVTDVKKEVYIQCRWTFVKREFTREGLRRIRRGTAMQREEVENAAAEL